MDTEKRGAQDPLGNPGKPWFLDKHRLIIQQWVFMASVPLLMTWVFTRVSITRGRNEDTDIC